MSVQGLLHHNTKSCLLLLFSSQIADIDGDGRLKKSRELVKRTRETGIEPATSGVTSRHSNLIELPPLTTQLSENRAQCISYQDLL